MEQLELRNQLQTLWTDLRDNPRNRALAVANVAAHHGDDDTRAQIARLIEQQTPESDEREQALKLLAAPPEPVIVVRQKADPLPDQAVVPTTPPDELMTLWYELGGNPRYRAQVMAGIVKRLGDKEIIRKFAELITHQTPPSAEKSRALLLLNPRPISHIHIIPDPPPKINTSLRADPEIARLTIALDCASEFRLWVIIRHLTREEEGDGIVSKKALKAALSTYGVHYTPRHFYRLLKQGEGVFWQVTEKRNIYLRSWIKLGLDIFRKADAAGMELNGNRPGARQSFIDVSGPLEKWEAAIYAGWICLREGVTIARETLSGLFGREANTIRRWESVRLEKEMIKRRNFVQCSDIERYYKFIPEHSIPYATRVYYNGGLRTHVRVRWQLPNTYCSNTFSCNNKGQGRKVRQAINAEYPPDLKPGGQCLRYLKSPKKLKTLRHSLKFRMGQMGDVYKPYYVLLGENYRTKHGIFEITNTGFLFTHRNERLAAASEQDILLGLGRKRARALREERGKNETLISPT